ncbi:unnamed protein product, partial [Rotaria sp. Silwood2]
MVGLLIGFACAPGTEANDNDEQENALYTKYLLEHIVKPNTDISKVLRAVTGAVVAESDSRQIPYYTDALVTTDDIYLYEKPS